MKIHKIGYTVLASMLGFFFSVPIYLGQGKWWVWLLTLAYWGSVFLLTKLKISDSEDSK